MSQDTSGELRKLWELIKETRFGMLSHRHADGKLHSHPLTTQNEDIGADGLLYFFVSRATELGQRIAQDGNVNVSYANVDKDTYVSITGTARVNEDMAKKKQLFNAMAKAWFPNGVEDPDVELIEVKIEDAEYWDVKQSKLRQIFTMAKSAVTGHPPRHMADHGEVHNS